MQPDEEVQLKSEFFSLNPATPACRDDSNKLGFFLETTSLDDKGNC